MKTSIMLSNLESFPPNHENPFWFDAYHMGVRIGTNVMVMMPNHANARCDYFIIVNIVTGERMRVSFADEEREGVTA
jgi:hypothetical protein